MSPEIIKALKGSIKKWERIAAGEGEDGGWHDCDLCLYSYNQHGFLSCTDCPVYADTGEWACRGTPQEEWEQHYDDMHPTESKRKVHCPECKRWAEAEVGYLKSLLPEKGERK